MKKKLVYMQTWKVGDVVISNTSDLGLTEGKEYRILERDVFPDCFYVINDEGEKEAYTEEYFEEVSQ